jgi:hypothetical protein
MRHPKTLQVEPTLPVSMLPSPFSMVTDGGSVDRRHRDSNSRRGVCRYSYTVPSADGRLIVLHCLTEFRLTADTRNDAGVPV